MRNATHCVALSCLINLLFLNIGLAAEYELALPTAAKSQSKTSNVAAGILVEEFHRTVAVVVDRETGNAFNCSFAVKLWFINGVFNREVERIKICTRSVTLTPPGPVNSFVLEPSHLIETIPGYSVRGGEKRYWAVLERERVFACIPFYRTVTGYPNGFGGSGSYACDTMTFL